MSNYSALLRDPRWQRKRLEVLQRADFRCEDCGRHAFLNVHHERYEGLPWEAPDDALACLCERCHRRRHALKEVGPATRAELELEAQIAAAELGMLTAPDAEARRIAWRKFAELIERRSPQQVKRMEIKRGLR